MAVVIDASALFALTDRREPSHARIRSLLNGEVEAIVVPQAVLPEACHLVRTRLGAWAEVALVQGLVTSDWRLEPLVVADMPRVAELVEGYADADLGFVDAALVATAERLGVRRIYTLDRRHFSLVRPRHAETFELLP